MSVTFKHPDRTVGGVPVAAPVETVQATTDASGNWSATSAPTTNRQDIGTWQVSSSYAGTAQNAASSAPACPVIVVNPNT